MPTNIYGPKAFTYIANNKDQIQAFAGRFNVAPTAVAAFIAKENNSYETTTGWDKRADRGLDDLATVKSYGMTDAQIRSDVALVIVSGIADKVAKMTQYEKYESKLLFLGLADVGPANIKVSTALRLVDKYLAGHWLKNCLLLLVMPFAGCAQMSSNTAQTMGRMGEHSFALAARSPAEIVARTEKDIDTPQVTHSTLQSGVPDVRHGRNPLLEFIRHIAETDNLYDSESLFSKTMGVINPPKPTVDPGALRNGLINQPGWPPGIRSINYMLVIPTSENTITRRSLGFSLDTGSNCIKITDIAASFANSYIRMPPPIFTHPVDGDPHTIQVKSPNLFQESKESNIQFRFYDGDCVTSVLLWHPLNFETHLKLQKALK